ncbi:MULTISPECIES: TerC family protein [unclassified Bacillus (in: firmicutes)]|uniref:TerC family protein n=1 Tax=unclassified Bacillus (in: firmicutes) TaxID=185979 RepID=UPI001BE9CA60|nr:MULTISPECIES: TerC family protein [unclassified Bacillus (in: firmicutes)]MBT2618440.1 TerC family protein [Bacillus sp. ISL-78]MBT2630695.1 TerC family protein [Bacillus sp. ISL-101]MBT2718768.1 TerC family protein [Bacillus sp. ISL-57]
MELSLLLEYGWVLIILIFLEGLLSADNALVLAIMSKHLPKEQQKKAINIGLLLAFIFRIGAIFIISYLFHVWQVQAIGAAYLIFISLKHLLKRDHGDKEKKGKSYRMTVAQIALADIAFAIDSILAAVALVIALPDTPMGDIGGMDGAKFIVILLGAIAGLIVIRFAAGYFVKVLTDRPSLETAAMLIVGWVGVKLLMHTLAHPAVHIISHDFVEGPIWNIIFWSVMLLIAIGGWFLSGKTVEKSEGK